MELKFHFPETTAFPSGYITVIQPLLELHREFSYMLFIQKYYYPLKSLILLL